MPLWFEGLQQSQLTEPPPAYISREYIWGPGDRGPDELLAMFAWDGVGGTGNVNNGTARPPNTLWSVITDASGDCVGLITEATLSQDAQVAWQATYEPYGTLIDSRSIVPHPHLKAGHKGLFAERLDGGVVTGMLGVDRGRLEPGATLLYHNRNRTFSPTLGRFLQSDPNASGLAVIGSVSYAGSRAMLDVMGADLFSITGDGVGLYGYHRGNPINGNDPTGLAWDPFDMVDEIIEEHQFSMNLAVAKLNSAIGDRKLLAAIRAYERGGWEWSDMVWDRDAAIIIGLVGGLPFSRACFVEGTPVATPSGQVAINQLHLGAEVVSKSDPKGPAEQHDAKFVDPALDAERLVVITLSYQRADGSTTRMEFVRPEALAEALNLSSGSRLPLDIEELRIEGDALVESIVPLPQPVRRDVAVVTGRFITDSADVVDVVLVNESCKAAFAGENAKAEPWTLSATPTHPIYSLTRQTWVEAGDLTNGERVATRDGKAVVQSTTTRSERAAVYNLEVSRWHTYFVGQGEVWAHNSCGPCPPWKAGQTGINEGQKTWVRAAIEGIKDDVKPGPLSRAIYLQQFGGRISAMISRQGLVGKVAETAEKHLMAFVKVVLDELKIK